MDNSSNQYVIRITGGLGNQMFQYAFARALEAKTGVKTYIDILDYKTAKRAYGLGEFFTRENISTDGREKFCTPHFKLRRQMKKIFGIPVQMLKSHCKESGFPYSEKLFQKEAPCFFEGLFQSEKYFSEIEETIRDEFRFRNEQIFQKNPLYNDINREDSVSIHIRCGDYLSRPRTRKKLYVCMPSYYRRAIDFFAEKLANPKFYIFTDDPEWVGKNMPFTKDFKIVNSSSAYEDMYLMSACKNNIISNSTFSWWAAWLNANPQKTVVAPDIWFTPSAKVDFKDIYPPSWKKLSSGYGQ